MQKIKQFTFLLILNSTSIDIWNDIAAQFLVDFKALCLDFQTLTLKMMKFALY